ncbi:NADPH-dependent diflavin oxidoreductase 1 [Tolypocladium ophioglossoides CBS 100239]|uniref:NADPH-dependent diflavin oxidoreductase 1 n=1 Tax=Tolypocladium ophioglossoides (strain CBS 100239) TaxID=1163406 RepID=A0A0L0N160_TOLOC|nr:NADPH-dependent diflavin oxidoreductase 1 [Tolypocladium ophioglossoides CBS 100239]
MAASDRTVLVLYGSETGNAQNTAEELGKLCQRLHFKSRVEELDAVDLGALLQFQLVIFVVSTTGQGDMPHNALHFWKKLLRKRLPPGCLAQLRYTCFGLGDSTYLKFNWAARKLVRRLEQLGASTFMEPCEADEQFPEGIDGSFVRWADDLRKHLLEQYPHPHGRQPIPEEVNLPPRWSLEPALRNAGSGSRDARPELLANGHAGPSTSNLPPSDLLPIPDSWTATIADNKKMTPDTHWQDVRLVSFDIARRGAGHKLHCNPGDCLTLYPKNFPEDAQRLVALMGWESVADQPLDLSLCGPLPPALYAPSPCTLRGLLLHNIDFTAVPRRSFLKSISYFSSDQDHRERLLEFTTTEFIDEYFDYATRSRRSIIEVLEEFSSVRVPPGRLLDVFPLIRGRDFSIANGGAKLIHPTREDMTRVELLVAMVKYRTILRKPRQGLCSRYLADLPAGTVIRVSHKSVLSPIHGPANAQRPLIAMATGTGIAPVRCLIHERLTHPSPAPALLFFGNRNRAADFFFTEEWEALARDRLLVFPAFSRDQREKIYVQDLIRRESPRLADLIPQLPIFAVCGGSTKMADACKNAVFDPFVEAGDEQERKKTLDAVTWWQEIW